MRRPSLRFLASRKFWQRLAFAFAILVTVIVVFYQVENARGRATWERYRREAAARGVKLDWRDFDPPPVPDAENFAAIPFLRQLGSGEASVSKAAGRLAKLPDTSDAFGNGHDGHPVDLDAENSLRLRLMSGLYSARSGEAVDFEAWRECFERSGRLSARTEDPAADVLRAMEDFEPVLAQFRGALPRPRNQIFGASESAQDADIFHLNGTLSLSRRLSLRIACLLAGGRAEEALIDWRVQYRLAEMFDGQPTLLAGMLRVILTPIATESVWHGIVREKWSEAQLAAIETVLREVDLDRTVQHAMASERAFCNSIMDEAKADGSFLETYYSNDRKKLTRYSWLRLVPQGWIAQNQRHLNEWHDDISAEPPHHESRELRPWQLWTPYWFMAGTARYLAGDNRRVALDAQAEVDLCRIACALVRFRIRYGAFPESLGGLVPGFLPALPPDRIEGQSLRYLRTDDGLIVSRHHGDAKQEVVWRVPLSP